MVRTTPKKKQLRADFQMSGQNGRSQSSKVTMIRVKDINCTPSEFSDEDPFQISWRSLKERKVSGTVNRGWRWWHGFRRGGTLFRQFLRT